MDICVLLVTFNRKADLEKTLSLYESQSYKPRAIIVVDNHSTDGTGEMLAEWSRNESDIKHIVVSMSENVGGSGGFYAGMEHALGLDYEWIFVSDDDAMPRNDTLEIISRFADKIGVRIINKNDIDTVELKRKTKFRQTLMDSRTALICKLETEIDKEIRTMIEEQIKHLNKLIKKIEASCMETAEKNQLMKNLVSRFTEIGGVGNLTAVSILAELPEIGRINDAKLNRLAGLAPEEKQSGSKEWQRRIWGGRKDVRNALYMATVAGIMWNSILRDYYRKKRAEGHPHKWAIVPTMRKLLSLLNRIARDPDFRPTPEPESTKRLAEVRRKRKLA